MEHNIQYDGDYALVVFSHPHHEDLVDVHDDGLPFYQEFEFVALGPDLEKNFKFHRAVGKHYMAAQMEFGKAFYDATAYANTRDIGRDSWYFARQFARAQGRAYLKNSFEAVRQLDIMFGILDLISAIHQGKKPVIEILDLGAAIAGVCFVGAFVVDDIVLARVLFWSAVANMVVLYFPLMVHVFLGYAFELCKKVVIKVRVAASQGTVTEDDIDALDNWVFWFLGFAAPKNFGPMGRTVRRTRPGSSAI